MDIEIRVKVREGCSATVLSFWFGEVGGGLMIKRIDLIWSKLILKYMFDIQVEMFSNFLAV